MNSSPPPSASRPDPHARHRSRRNAVHVNYDNDDDDDDDNDNDNDDDNNHKDLVRFKEEKKLSLMSSSSSSSTLLDTVQLVEQDMNSHMASFRCFAANSNKDLVRDLSLKSDSSGGREDDGDGGISELTRHLALVDALYRLNRKPNTFTTNGREPSLSSRRSKMRNDSKQNKSKWDKDDVDDDDDDDDDKAEEDRLTTVPRIHARQSSPSFDDHNKEPQKEQETLQERTTRQPGQTFYCCLPVGADMLTWKSAMDVMIWCSSG